jgi:uncharacterized protein YbbC (DUF1343 family)
VRFVPITFTPTSAVYANQKCEGVNIVLTDRNALDAPELGIELASALRKLYPSDYKIDRINELLVNQSVYDALTAGEDPRCIAQDLVQYNAAGQPGAGRPSIREVLRVYPGLWPYPWG